jgi:hypothetical protein
MAAVLRTHEGQMLPVVAMLLVAILAVGVVAVQIGKATVLRADAQTAADAAALAAARNIRDQLNEQLAATGTSSLDRIVDARVQAAAAQYADKNHARLRRPVERDGADVKVWVETKKQQGDGGPSKSDEERRGDARARARLQLMPLFPSFSAGGSVPLPSGGDPKISDDEWKALKKKLEHHPPQCSSNQDDNDLVLLGELLAKHGFQNGENAQLGDPPSHTVGHNEAGWHFKCGDSGAIDLNWPGSQAQEDDAINPLIGPLQDLGFRTIWQIDDHKDHVHIDTGNGPPLGPGGLAGAGAAGPLQDTFLETRLIDWDAPAPTFTFPFGSIGAGGNPFGPPDPQIAALTCAILAKYHVNGKARLALWEALIVESGVHNLPDGDSSSVGVLQALDIHGSYETRMNPAWQIEMFLFHGWTRGIGAIAWAKSHWWETAGQIAQDMQGSDYPYRYDQHEAGAIALNQEFCGGDGL